jgi:phage tail-like protein
MEPHDAEMGRLLEYLPAVYHGLDDTDLQPSDQEYSGRPPFLNYFLLAFEDLLLGRKDHPAGKGAPKSSRGRDQESSFESLEDEIHDLHRIFEPERTPARFLEWLAGWGALSLEASLSLEKKRRLVARIIPLYRIRGTKAYVEELLRLHLEAEATIAVEDEERPHLQVGRQSTIGQDCYLGGGGPHWFRVRLAFPETDWRRVEPQCQLARRVIDLAKPAHTLYELSVQSHRMQVGVHSTVGVDTIFGS